MTGASNDLIISATASFTDGGPTAIPVSIAQGGTGATTLAGAQTALGIDPGATPLYQQLGVSSYTDYMAANSLPTAGSVTVHTTNVQNWLLYAQLLALKNRPSVSGDNITQRTYIEADYPRGGYNNETNHVNCPIIVPSYVGLNCRERILREGSTGTITARYTGDTTTKGLANLEQPTVIFVPGSHNIGDLNLNCNSNNADNGSGVYCGKNWTMASVAGIAAAGTGYTNGDVLSGINPDGSPYSVFKINVTGVDGSGAVTSVSLNAAGAYALPPILQQLQWTAANATLTGYAALGNVFDPAHAGWYKTTGGTGTGAEFTITWNNDFSGAIYQNGAALGADMILGPMSIQQCGTVNDGTYGPMFAFGIGGLNYDLEGVIKTGGGYNGVWFNGVADVHGGQFNAVNGTILVKMERGASINTSFQLDTPTQAAMLIDGTASVTAQVEIINTGGAITGVGTVAIGSDTAFSNATHKASGINLNIVTKNVGGTGIPALYLDYMEPCSINCVVANVGSNNSAVAHPNDFFATFGSNNTDIGLLTGSIDGIAGAIFSGTIPNSGINVWDKAAPGFAEGGGRYSLAGAGAPTSGGSGTGLNKAGVGSVYTDTTNGPLYYNSTASSSPTWNQFAGSAPTVVAVSGTTKTLALSDAYTIQDCSNAAAQTITIPLNASVAFVNNTVIQFEQNGVGSLTVVGANGVTVNGTNAGSFTSNSQYSAFYLRQESTDTWYLESANSFGQKVSSNVASPGSGITSATPANVTSISLTAGEWDVSGTVAFTANAATTATIFSGGISTTSATLPTSPGAGGFFQLGVTVGAGGAEPCQPTGTVRLSLSATTTVYLVAQATFAVNTMNAYGYISARRIGD